MHGLSLKIKTVTVKVNRAPGTCVGACGRPVFVCECVSLITDCSTAKGVTQNRTVIGFIKSDNQFGPQVGLTGIVSG